MEYLSSIVQGYGYKNVKEFLTEYRASKAGYSDYQSAVVKWEQQTENKAESDSLKAKLQRKQQEAKTFPILWIRSHLLYSYS